VGGAPPPSVASLFLAFAEIAICGFGGVLVWARRIIVERRRWLTDAQFTDMFSLVQFLPGPNVVNLALVLGDRFWGPVGAFAAYAGIVVPPFVLYVTAGLLYDSYGKHLGALDGALNGVALVAGGMAVATGMKMAKRLLRIPRAVAVIAGTFLCIAPLGLPLAWVIVVMAPLSIALAAFSRRAP
jgi:chromate transporter